MFIHKPGRFVPGQRQVLRFPSHPSRHEMPVGVEATSQGALRTELLHTYVDRELYPGSGRAGHEQLVRRFLGHLDHHDVTRMGRQEYEVAHQLLAGEVPGNEVAIRPDIDMGYIYGVGFYVMPKGAGYDDSIVRIQRGDSEMVHKGGNHIDFVTHLRHGDFVKLNDEDWFIFHDPLVAKGHPLLTGGSELYRGRYIYPVGMPDSGREIVSRLLRMRGTVENPRATLLKAANGEPLVRLVSDGGSWMMIELVDGAEAVSVRLVEPGNTDVTDLEVGGEQMALLADDTIVQFNDRVPVQMDLRDVG
jgi:hypothetical protein